MRPCGQVLKIAHPSQLEEAIGPRPALTPLAANQVGWGWRRAGRNSLNPSLLSVCLEANCWENPMT